MYFCTKAFVILIFFTNAFGTPVPARESVKDACIDLQNSSVELNRIAKHLSIKAGNGTKTVIHVSDELSWMEVKDKCDPGTLRNDHESCITKIVAVLEGYNGIFEMLASSPSCSEFASQLKPALHNLRRDMNRCVNKTELKPKIKIIQPSEWPMSMLCTYYTDRLFSFSIFTARVFAPGHPANHGQGAAERCIVAD